MLCEEEESAAASAWKPNCGEELADLSMEKAYDWLEADDPALFSDEFSDSEFSHTDSTWS